MLRRGSIRDASVFMYVSPGTVSRLWQSWTVAHTNALNGEWDVTTGKKSNGRPIKYPRDGFVQAVRQLPFRNRGHCSAYSRLRW